MTVELLGEDAPNAVVLVLHHLLPIGPTPAHFGIERTEDAPVPFRMVTLLDAADDLDEQTSEALVSVHTFARALDGVGGVDADTLAVRERTLTHRRMPLLGRDPQTDVPMPDNTLANIDWLRVIERPALRDYRDDNTSRVKAVYRIGLSFVAL